MKLKLKNIGTLKQAEIDLSKDLIILAGPNNTGKTYAAYTVYGVCDLLNDLERVILYTKVKDIILSKLLSTILNRVPAICKINIEEIVELFLDEISEKVESIFPLRLSDIFATEEVYFKQSDLEFFFDKNKIKNSIKNFMIIAQEVLTPSTQNNVIISKKENDTFIYINILEANSEITHDLLKISTNISNLVVKNIFESFFNNIFINTAERSAINIFSKELSIKRNNIVDQLLELRDAKNGDANQLLGKLQRYPLPIRDSLAISEDLANLSRNKSEYGFLADRIEEVLLDGKITTSKEGEVQYSPNKSKVKNLSIHLTASIVKSLSNLVFYFRHIAQKGDFIIIDEPELNLHPDNQRKVARLFGEIINQGFKVMISTHSDYIIRELNNLIMLKSGGEKAEYLTNKYGYEEKQLIDYQRVGAYLFNDNKNTSLEVTETGFEVSTIDAVINELNNASEEIYLTLFD